MIQRKTLNHASLFTGIGGFDLAASWMGWENVFQCEIDPFCQKLLQNWFPESELFSDIKTSNFTHYQGKIDVISGGFPCQPFSVAGKRQCTDDDRYLWPEMLRVLREVQPRWFVGENVCGLLTGQSGVVFERVCADLEDAGYKVQSVIIPACAVDAPHRRERIWIVAHTDSVYAAGQGHEQTERTNGTDKSEGNVTGNRTAVCFGDKGITAITESLGLQRGEQAKSQRKMEKQFGRLHCPCNKFDLFPTQSPVCNRDDGLSGGLDDIAFSKWRKESIKALGNAIVPQVAFQIFRAIESVKS